MKKKKNVIIYLLIGILLVGTIGVTSAKYISKIVKNYYFKSRGFYFTSDKLGDPSINNIDTNWDGSSIRFNVSNNLNQELITNYDITYQAVCTVDDGNKDYVSCNMNGTNSNSYTGTLSNYEYCVNNTEDDINVDSFDKVNCELNGYDWTSQISTSDLYFDIVKKDLNYSLDDITVTVTVTSIAPYEKVLTGNFVLSKGSSIDDQLSLDCVDYDGYNDLIITNSYAKDKCVSVYWDSDNIRIFDDDFDVYNNDPNGYINSITINIEAKSSKNYKFYSNNTISANNFALTESSECQQ